MRYPWLACPLCHELSLPPLDQSAQGMPDRMRPHALCHKQLGLYRKASDLSAVLHTHGQVCWHKPATARLHYKSIQMIGLLIRWCR